MSTEPTSLRLYRPPIRRTWWLHRRSYLMFVLREVSCVFVAWAVVFLLLMINAVHAGEDAYQRFLAFSGNPWVLVLNIVALAFVLLHAITWFNLAPKAIVLTARGKRLAPRAVAAAHFGAWLVATVVVGWIVLGGR
jgi:fumarate reductase subunit C